MLCSQEAFATIYKRFKGKYFCGAVFLELFTDSIEQSSWEINSYSARQEIPCLLWTPKVHYHVPRAHHWSLFWARWKQSTPSHPISLRPILILSYLHLSLPNGLLPSGFLTKILYAFLIFSMCATRPTHIILWFDHLNNIWWSIQVMKFFIMQFSPASLIGPNFSAPCSQKPSIYVVLFMWPNFMLIQNTR